MEIQTKLVNNTGIIELKGELDIYNTTKVRDAADEFIKNNILNISIILDDITYIDSSGIGVLIATQTELNRIGGKLLIKCDKSINVQRIFELTKLVNFFNFI